MNEATEDNNLMEKIKNALTARHRMLCAETVRIDELISRHPNDENLTWLHQSIENDISYTYRWIERIKRILNASSIPYINNVQNQTSSNPDKENIVPKKRWQNFQSIVKSLDKYDLGRITYFDKIDMKEDNELDELTDQMAKMNQ